MASKVTTVTTAATQIYAAASSTGSIILTNSGRQPVYVGIGPTSNTVTKATGIPLAPGQQMVINAPESARAIHAIGEENTSVRSTDTSS